MVGKHWGKNNEYKVFGKKALTKSIAGTAAFVVLAYVSLLIGALLGGADYLQQNVMLALVILPVLATIFENTMPYGFDNLFSPLVATILLNSLI